MLIEQGYDDLLNSVEIVYRVESKVPGQVTQTPLWLDKPELSS